MEISSFVQNTSRFPEKLKISRVKFISRDAKLIKITVVFSFFYLFIFFLHIEAWIVDIRAAVSSANLRDLSFHKSVLWSWQ